MRMHRACERHGEESDTSVDASSTTCAGGVASRTAPTIGRKRSDCPEDAAGWRARRPVDAGPSRRRQGIAHHGLTDTHGGSELTAAVQLGEPTGLNGACKRLLLDAERFRRHIGMRRTLIAVEILGWFERRDAAAWSPSAASAASTASIAASDNRPVLPCIAERMRPFPIEAERRNDERAIAHGGDSRSLAKAASRRCDSGRFPIRMNASAMISAFRAI